ncbi:HTH domain-containing protein [Chryseobacterium sp. KACC 21268]|nr:HTH domain-containing protein [Chryseobacterium sp. KACC 21268]
MTIKEAILKSLEDLKVPVNNNEVLNHITSKTYYQFLKGKTPGATISAQLGEFIRNGDSRVKRIKKTNGSYNYYLTKNEQQIGIEILNDENEVDISNIIEPKIVKAKVYEERDLHKLLSSYLKNTETFSKTIFHEQSNGKDSNQIWTHPDMVGIKFLNLQTKVSQNFLKSINRVDTFKLSSYELKREINSDSELKKAYFQAVSNSSWANYGFLVAFEFSDSLYEEMARLNQSFGIGIIELNANPYQSKILFPAVFRDLDFKTIDKLCKINKEFENFIEQTEKLLTASEKYISGAEKELNEFSDKYFSNDSEIEKYCKDKNIPFEK